MTSTRRHPALPAVSDVSTGWCCATARSPPCAGDGRRPHRVRTSSTTVTRVAPQRFLSLGEVSDTLVDQLCATAIHGRASRWSRGVRWSTTRGRLPSPPTPPSAAARPKWRSPSTIASRAAGWRPRCSNGWPRPPRSHGFRWFQAMTSVDNDAMLEVFRDSGFELRVAIGAGRRRRPAESRAVARRRGGYGRAAPRGDASPRCGRSCSPRRSPWSASRASHSASAAASSTACWRGFAGPVYPVNRGATEIAGHRVPDRRRATCRRASTSPSSPSRRTPCSRWSKTARAPPSASLVVISAGFAETGDEGRRRQQRGGRAGAQPRHPHGRPQLHGRAQHRSGVRLNASFADRLPPHGRIALASQSGGLGLDDPAAGRRAADRHLDVRQSRATRPTCPATTCCSTARATRTRRSSCCTSNRSGTRAASRSWRAASADTSRSWSIKAGRTHAGSRAAGSHTAGLASSDVAVAALFQAVGRHPRRHHRRDVRRRRVPRPAAAAARRACGHHHERRRAGHPRRRRLRSGGARWSPNSPSDTRPRCARSCRAGEPSATRSTWSRRRRPSSSAMPSR